jgi:hypothetical protein
MLLVPNVEVLKNLFDESLLGETLCTGHGHLPSECFGAGKKYDLLPEDDG